MKSYLALRVIVTIREDSVRSNMWTVWLIWCARAGCNIGIGVVSVYGNVPYWLVLLLLLSN